MYLLWGLGFACMVWGGWVYAVLPQSSWQFIPSPDNLGEEAINGDNQSTQSGISFATWLSLYSVMILPKAALPLGSTAQKSLQVWYKMRHYGDEHQSRAESTLL